MLKGSTGTVLREFTFFVVFLKTVPGHPLALSSFSTRICSPFATGSPRTVLNILNKFPIFGNFSKLSLGTLPPSSRLRSAICPWALFRRDRMSCQQRGKDQTPDGQRAYSLPVRAGRATVPSHHRSTLRCQPQVSHGSLRRRRHHCRHHHSAAHCRRRHCRCHPPRRQDPTLVGLRSIGLPIGLTTDRLRPRFPGSKGRCIETSLGHLSSAFRAGTYHRSCRPHSVRERVKTTCGQKPQTKCNLSA